MEKKVTGTFPGAEKPAEPVQDSEMEVAEEPELSQKVAILLKRLPNMTNSGFGTRY